MTLYDAQTALILATDPSLTTNTITVTVNPQTAASLSLSAASTNVTAGGADQLTITAYDTYGNIATNYTGNENYTFSGASTIGTHHPTVTNTSGTVVNFGTSETITFSNGVSASSPDGVMTLYDAQTALIVAADTSLTSNTVSVTVNPQTAASLSLSAASTNVTAGGADQLTITAYDTYGNIATNYTGNENYTFSGASTIGTHHPTVTNTSGTVVNFGTSETITFSNGVSASSPDGVMTLYDAQTALIVAADTSLTSNTVSVTVNPQTAASLSLSAASTNVTAGGADQLTITAYDTYGNIATNYTGNENYTFSGASVSGYSTHPTVSNTSGTVVNFGTSETITFSNGVSASSPDGVMTLYDAQTALIVAADTSLTSNTVSVTVNPQTAASLSLSAASTNVTAGGADQLTITAYDTYGNIATNYTGNENYTFSGASVSGYSTHPTVSNTSGTVVNFGTSETITFSNGISTSSPDGVMTLYDAQTALIVAADTSLTSNTVSVTVNPQTAASLSLSAASTNVTAGGADQLTITAYDTYGNIATNYTGNENYTFSGASTIGTHHPTVTNTSGTVVNFGTSETITFSNGVSASSPDGVMTLYDAQTALIVAADTSLTSNTVSVTVNPQTAASLSLSAASTNVTAGGADQLTITAYDTYGNIATNYTGNENYTFSGASTIGTHHPTVTNSSGTVVNFGTSETITFSNGVSASSPDGVMTLYDAQTALILANDPSLTTNTITVTVNPQTAASLSLSAASTNVTAGATDQLTITAYDTYGNIATNYTGNENYTFSGASVSGYSTHPTVTNTSGTVVNFGTSETITFSNGVSASSPDGVMTLYDAQTALIVAADTSLTSNTVSVTVNPQTAASLSLSAASTDVTAGGLIN